LFTAWERAATEAVSAEPSWTVLKPDEALSANGAKLRVDADGVITAEKDPSGGTDIFRIKVQPGLGGLVGLRIEALPSEHLPAHGPGRAKDGRFVLTEFRVEAATGAEVELAEATATFATAGFVPGNAIDGNTNSNNGWAVQALSGTPQSIYFATHDPLDAADDGPLTLVLTQNHGDNAVLGRFRIAATTDPAVVHAPKTALPAQEIVEILNRALPERTDEQSAKLAAYHRSVAPELADLRKEVAAAQQAKDEFEATVPRCLVSISDKPRTVRILPRGNFLVETGDIVEPALPVYLAGPHKSGEGERRLTRLDLAEWLVSRQNPLTARVVINRLWKQVFGIGLSKVLDDFGAQGEPPRNPALLDWLACEFMDSGWDVKHMVRLMVTSHTYKQVSTGPKELLTRDPDNRELARQSRWRLDAELVRDDALSISGLLTARIGGPSVKPYQPDGYWENLNFPIRTYEASKGPDQYRRGVYTWWQRSYLHPSLLAFDAPTREECAAERTRSNIPQQALVLLNDPTYVEAARMFAARILQQGGNDTPARITWAWEQALARAPRTDEMETVQALLYKHLSEYKQKNDAADALLGVGLAPAPAGLDHAELAAWTSVARVILNLHETITRS
jgi:hypothetical protein